MKKIITLLSILVIIFTSCYSHKFKYEIHGFIKTNQGIKDKIWYTDTIEVSGDSVGYHNSNGSYIMIGSLINKKGNNVMLLIDTLK